MSTAAVPLVLEARETTRRVARTFSIACRLLPRHLRDDVYLLYLVFRTLDDLVDDGDPHPINRDPFRGAGVGGPAGPAAARVAAVRAWCDGAPPASREARILAELASRHDIARDAMREFCAGMEHDLAGGPLENEADLDRYCYRVAGTVGVVMAGILGTTDPERALPAAAALGMAMQRTNILRDIDEDHANGRVYLAAATVTRFGGSFAPGDREALVRDQIARADALYDQGMAGISLLCHGRRAVAAAAGMYREILRQIEREGYGREAGRAVVPQRRKLAIAARRGALVR